MLKQGKAFLLFLMASLVAMPFPCAFACGLQVSKVLEAQGSVVEKVRTCHSPKVEISVAPSAATNVAHFSRPASVECPILLSLNQGWSQSLMVKKASDAQLKETLHLGLIPLPFSFLTSEDSVNFSREDSKDPLPPALPLYLINPVLRV